MILSYQENTLTAISETPIAKKEIQDKEQLLKETITGKTKMKALLYTPWSKTFKTEFLKQNNLVYPTDIKIGEDSLFNLKAYVLAQNISYLNVPLYAYRIHSASTMNRYHKNFEDEDILYQNHLKECLRGFPTLDYLRHRSAFLGIITSMRLSIFNKNNTDGIKQKKETVSILMNKSPYKEALQAYPTYKSTLDTGGRFVALLCRKHKLGLLRFLFEHFKF